MKVKNVDMDEYVVKCINVKIEFSDKGTDEEVDAVVDKTIEPLLEAGYEQTNLEEFYELEDGHWDGYYIAYMEKVEDGPVR